MPINERVIRLNPLIQPVLVNGTTWDFPPGLDRAAFRFIRDLDMDAIEQDQVTAIEAFCDLWIKGNVRNQPIRADGRTLAPEIGFGSFPDARAPVLDRF